MSYGPTVVEQFPGKPEWQEGFEASGGALTCETCGAKVAQSPKWTKRHRDWHAKVDRD